MKKLLIALCLLLGVPALSRADVQVAAGATSQCFDVKVLDTSATTPTNAGKTGLAYNSSTLTCEYHRDTASAAVAITMASSTLGTYTSGAWKEVSSSLQPGVYQFCPPDAALAIGASTVSFTCTGVSGMSQMDLRVQLLSPLTYGFDGALAAKSTTSLTLSTGAIDADDQFANQEEVVFFDSAGLVEASSCITASVASTEVVTTAEDISALLTVGDKYIIRPNSACRALRATTAGRTLTVGTDGTITGSISTSRRW